MSLLSARRSVLAGLTAAALALAGPVSALVPTGNAIPVGTFTSDNVEWYGNIPLDSPGVGGKVVTRDDGVRYFYVTGAYGLSIYDTTVPAQPQLVSHLAYPHSQNEDVEVSDDGTRVVLAADGSLPYSPNYLATGLHIINVDDVTNPFFEAATGTEIGGQYAVLGSSEHTSACADPSCEWIYGSSGRIYDATEPGVITATDVRWNEHDFNGDGEISDVDADGDGEISEMEQEAVGGRHALNRDASGLLISDSDARLVLDVTNRYGTGGTYANPAVVTRGASADYDAGKVDHNNVRVGALDWSARTNDPADVVLTTTDFTVPDRSNDVSGGERPIMRPGEMFLGTTESNINPQCGNVGGLSTWSMINFDRGEPLQQLEVFRPYNGTWADGSPAAQAAGCSGHWFTERDGIVAAAWYEHGVHFFDVDATTGTIEEVGFFQSVTGITSAVYWVDDEFAYTVDGVRGIDIIRFDREADAPAEADLETAWLRSLFWNSPLAEELRALCYLAASDTR